MALIADSLIVIGLATASLGTIQEADGPVERTFWLRNAGSTAVTLQQGYTSCGCTTILFAKDKPIAPGDSTAVTLRFNPRGKADEFEEVGTITYGSEKVKVKNGKLKHLNLSLTGTCISSEESLIRQFPVRINDHLRLSTNRFDLGIIHVGESKERNVIVLHMEQGSKQFKGSKGSKGSNSSKGPTAATSQERIPITFSVDAKTPKGLQHIKRPITTRCQGKKITLDITFDVMVK